MAVSNVLLQWQSTQKVGGLHQKHRNPLYNMNFCTARLLETQKEYMPQSKMFLNFRTNKIFLTFINIFVAKSLCVCVVYIITIQLLINSYCLFFCNGCICSPTVSSMLCSFSREHSTMLCLVLVNFLQQLKMQHNSDSK